MSIGQEIKNMEQRACILCKIPIKGHPTDCMKNRLCEVCLKKEGVSLCYEGALSSETKETGYYPSNQEIREYEWFVKTGRI